MSDDCGVGLKAAAMATVAIIVGVFILMFASMYKDARADQKEARRQELLRQAAAQGPAMTVDEIRRYDGCEFGCGFDSLNVRGVWEGGSWNGNIVFLHLSPEMYAWTKNQDTLDWKNLNLQFGGKTAEEKQ